MMDNLALPELLLAGVVGVSLATAVGFRIFAPMLLVGLAAKTGHLHLAVGFEWLGSDVAILMLGVAAVAEIAAYFSRFLIIFWTPSADRWPWVRAPC